MTYALAVAGRLDPHAGARADRHPWEEDTRVSARSDLWSRARSGDARARHELGVLAHGVARARVRAAGVRDCDLADVCRDVVASTFRYLHGGAEQDVRHLHAFVGWRVRAVLKRYWVDRKRRAREVPSDASGCDDRALVDRHPSPESVACLREASTLIRDCIAQLRREDADLLRLRFVEGMTPQQIASDRALSGNHVRGRIFRALRDVRRRLRARGLDACSLV